MKCKHRNCGVLVSVSALSSVMTIVNCAFFDCKELTAICSFNAAHSSVRHVCNGCFVQRKQLIFSGANRQLIFFSKNILLQEI